MENRSYILKDLLLDTRDGDWGEEASTSGYVRYRVIRGTDFPQVRSGDLSTVPIRYISEASASRRTLLAGDILIETAGGSRDRPTGRVILITDRLVSSSDLPLTCASFCRFMRVNPRIADPSYVHWYLEYLYHSGEMWQHQVQHTGIARFQYTRFAATVPIPLLPLPEQCSIARILSVLDDKIELNRRMNATLEALARALFTSWFVDFDPVRAKGEGHWLAGMDAPTAAWLPDGFEESEIGPIPRGWQVRPLDSIATFLNGLALQNYPPLNDEDWLPVIKIAELHRGNTEGSDLASGSIDPQYVVNDGDVLFSWSGSLEVVVWCGGRGALNQHLFKVMSPDFPKWLVYQWSRYHLPEFQAIAAGKATTMGHIQRHHLTSALVVVPPSTLIKAMTAVMQPLLDQVVNNNLESRTLAAIRDALLPKLLSGTVRVRDAETMVEAAI